MTKTADIGSKRLISLAPEVWARWLTGDPAVEVLDFLSGEFQWVTRATDVLLKDALAETSVDANKSWVKSGLVSSG